MELADEGAGHTPQQAEDETARDRHRWPDFVQPITANRHVACAARIALARFTENAARMKIVEFEERSQSSPLRYTS